MDKRQFLEIKYLEKRKMKRLKKNTLHEKLSEQLQYAWSLLSEVLDLKDVKLRIVLKGSCFFKNFPERVIQIGLENIISFQKELNQNKIYISNVPNLATYVLLHELGHFLDKRRFKRTVKKK